MTLTSLSFDEFKHKLAAHLRFVYPDHDADYLTHRCIEAINRRKANKAVPHESLWSEEDVLLGPVHTIQISANLNSVNRP